MVDLCLNNYNHTYINFSMLGNIYLPLSINLVLFEAISRVRYAYTSDNAIFASHKELDPTASSKAQCWNQV